MQRVEEKLGHRDGIISRQKSFTPISGTETCGDITMERRTFVGALPLAVGGVLAFSAKEAVAQTQATSIATVRDYGATGNGTTDDTAAFLAASAAGVGVVPPGNYLIGTTATIGITLDFLPGAELIVQAGVVLTLGAGVAAADMQQIFNVEGEVRGLTRASVHWFGAVGNGATDDSGAINTALASVQAGSVVFLQSLVYRVSTGVLVPAGVTLQGLSVGTNAAGGAPEILGDLSLPNIVTINGGAASASTALLSVTVNRASGGVPAGSSCVYVTDTNNAVLQDVYALRSAVGIALIGTTETNAAVYLDRCCTSQVTEYHVQIADSVGITFTNCYFGRNGGLDVASSAYVNINGAAVDTIRFQGCQFNQSGAATGGVIYFSGYANNPNGIISFEQCHAENWAGYVVSFDDATTNVRRIKFVNCTINGTGLMLNSTPQKLVEFMLTGNIFDGNISLTLDQQVESVLTGNVISGEVVVNAGSQIITSNYFGNNVLLEGASAKTVFVGNGVAGTLTNNMTGTIAIANNA